MHPPLWHPPVELSAEEQVIVSRIRRAKLFIFLRQVRQQIFDDCFFASCVKSLRIVPKDILLFQRPN